MLDIEILRNKMINQYNNYNNLTNEYYNPTYIMIGFSLGSFILRAHQLRYPNRANKLIYIVTGNPDINSLKFTKLIIKFIFFKEKESRIIKYMAFDIYNKGLKENRDKQAAWLIKNDNIRNEYLRDKNVHLKMTPRFFNEFLKCMIYVCNNEKNNLNLYDDSVLFLSGELDPISDIKSKNFNKMIKIFMEKDMKVEFKVINNYYHDILHDECKQQVYKIIEEFLK